MYKKALLLVLCGLGLQSRAQEVMLQGWYWDYPKTAQAKWWVDTLRQKTKALAEAGFTHIWLPPLSKSASGNNSNGYDIKDYFDLGIYPTSTQFGNETRLLALIDSMNKYQLTPIADMIYNHRSGGKWENNPSVEGWIENYNLAKHNSGDACYPSDRFRCVLPIGGSSGLGAGTYYFKIRSASMANSYYNNPYVFKITTKKVKSSSLPDLTESEPNGGADCGQPNNYYGLARNLKATIDAGGCGTDEFALTLTTSDFYDTGDTLFITLTNENGAYSDHYIYGLWYTGTNSNIQHKIIYQTATDFSGLKSGRGTMNHFAFKPNGNPTCLCGDLDGMWFYYDLDQNVPAVADTLKVWTQWMMEQFDMQGFRVDAVKHIPASFLGDLLDYLHQQGLNPKLVVGESYDYDATVLRNRLDEVYAHMDQATKNAMYYSLFDFNLQACLRDACDAFGYDVRNVFQCGLNSVHSVFRKNIVTFVNNHDFREASQSVDNDPILAYVYILTNPVIGIPCVYWTDYYSKKYPSYTEEFNAVLRTHFRFLQGAQQVEYLNRYNSPFPVTYFSGAASTTLAYQITGSTNTCLPDRDALVVINFSGQTLKANLTVNTASPFKLKPGDTLSDVLGRSAFDYAIINSNNQVYVELPPRSYSVWARVPPVKHTPIISANGPTEFCHGESVVLSMTNPPIACYDYRWKRNGVSIPGATGPLLTVTQSGTYTLEASYNGSQAKVSAPIYVSVSPEKPSIVSDGITLTCTVENMSYQWLKGNTPASLMPIPAATAQSYTPDQSAYYAVQITDTNGCSNQSDPLQFWMIGMPQADHAGIRLYPNPADQRIELALPNGKGGWLRIETITGAALFQQHIPPAIAQLTIDISELPAAVYRLKWTNEKETYIKLFTKF
ncbi:MAG: alpha-amylase family glycosyl hydrolase [Chitinophagales bacterium]|nr:alpha-amylase family glycosyl hydrolase [Chitinophagales bacterium]MDW8427487.1 alpha-amylase family glycosyl hydrolase [Chitinophagales bacterium]